MLKTLSLFMLTYTMLIASVKPLHVELNMYRNISFITKSYSLDKSTEISLKLPFESTLEEINIKAKRCKIDSLDLSDVLELRDSVEDELMNKISKLRDRIASLREKNTLLKTLSLKDVNLKKAKDILKFFTKNYAQNQNQITSLLLSLKTAKKVLKKAEKEKRQKYKRLKILLSCEQKAKLSVTYPEYSFRAKSYYTIDGDVENSMLELSKKLKIMQNSGEDYEKINIIAHSNIYNHKIQPREFYPRYLNLNKTERVLYAQANFLTNKSRKVAKHIQNFTTSAFVLKNVELLNNQEKILTIEKQKYRVVFQNDIDGYGTKMAYLRASFKSDKFLQGSSAYIRLNGDQIGTINLKDVKKSQKVDIYFGNNQNIKVVKNLLKRYSESKFFGNKEVVTQVWLYKIQNLSKEIQKINLIERVPISQNEEIEVSPLFDTKKAKISKKGKVVYSFELAPEQKKEIKFGYKITKPKSEKK